MHKLILYYWKKKKFKKIYTIQNNAGAATYNYNNINYLLNIKIFKIYFTEHCYRHFDSYLIKKNKLFIHKQIQIICKPVPFNFINIYKESIYFLKNLFFKKDNWKSPLLGAKGIGYEVLYYKIEISQITLFSLIGNKFLFEPFLEITYGVERINNIKNINLIKEKFLSINNIYNKFSIKKIFFLYYQCILNLKKTNIYVSYYIFIKITNNFNLIDNFYLSNNYNRIKIINFVNLLSQNIMKKIL
ncbi:glycine--tRNA ligase subunit alpha [Candidatus Carsonella ruddii]|uniref:glycine--tRNA ligase subunit alpha n=1 Tax=Carsonella ruddii TaxID=114186 RepID=UPI003D3E3798